MKYALLVLLLSGCSNITITPETLQAMDIAQRLMQPPPQSRYCWVSGGFLFCN